MAVMIRSQYPDLYDSLLAAIDTVYIQSRDLDETRVPWKKLFSVKKSDRQFEQVTGISGFGQFASVSEGDDVPLMSVAQLYDKKFTHTKWAGAWSVTEEMQDDDQFEQVASYARAFARSFRFTKEVNFANVFNNGFSSETSADGSAIFASHTLYAATAISNNAASDLGVSAAQTMFNHFATLTDDQGLRVSIKPKYIVAHPNMRWVIEEVFKSQLKPYTTDNETNALKSAYGDYGMEMILWPELTDTDAWFVVADPDDVNGLGLRAYERKGFEVSTDFKPENLTMLSVGRGRWSRGCVDWRQVYGSTGA